jgi:chemotaxis protein methyltransferase CheR
MGVLGSSLTLRKQPKISDAEFAQLRDFIYDKTGISIPDKRKYLLENRLGVRLQELNLASFKDYYDYLRLDANRTREMDALCERITTNETSFFRDIKQLTMFKDHILRETIERQEQAGRKELSIWSAGCSSGEEPYTLAILLHEVLGMSIIGWRIRITANDLSPAMLAKCRRGVYGDYALRTTPKGMLTKYFDDVGGGEFQIKSKVQKLVSFGPINLSDRTQLRRVPPSQIVFCRNVIIYFDDPMKKQVVSAFYDNLVPGGHLFLGHSESIHKLSTAFRPVFKPGGIAYVKA